MVNILHRTRIATLLATVATTGLFVAQAQAQTEPGRDIDLLITRGTVYDGSLNPPKIEDVGIVGDRIVFIGDAPKSGIRAK